MPIASCLVCILIMIGYSGGDQKKGDDQKKKGDDIKKEEQPQPKKKEQPQPKKEEQPQPKKEEQPKKKSDDQKKKGDDIKKKGVTPNSKDQACKMIFKSMLTPLCVMWTPCSVPCTQNRDIY